MRGRKPGTGKRVAWTVLAVLPAIGGCFGKQPPPPPPPPPPVHELCLEGTPRLNWFEDRPHTVFVRVFQLSEVGAFGQADLRHLLDSGTQIAGGEGAVVDRTVYPDSKVMVRFTQQPDAEYVGIVAAYYRVEGTAKVHLPMKSLDGGPCVRLGANAIEPPPVNPPPPEPGH